MQILNHLEIKLIGVFARSVHVIMQKVLIKIHRCLFSSTFFAVSMYFGIYRVVKSQKFCFLSRWYQLHDCLLSEIVSGTIRCVSL